MWIGIGLASFFVFLLIILSIPLDLDFSFVMDGRIHACIKIAWFFGLIERDIKRGRKKTAVKRPGRKKSKRRKFSPRKMIKIFVSRGFARQVKIFVTDIFWATKIRKLVIDFSMGFDNPADTGFLFAAVGPGLLFINSTPGCSIKINPSFKNQDFLEGSVRAAVRFQPLRFIIPFVKFVFSLSTLRAAREVIF